MNKETNKLIPDLRFPEFVNEGEWEEKELSELGELINGLTYSPSDVQEKGLLVLRSSNIQNGQIDLNDCVFVNPDIKGVNLTDPDDILICVRNGSKNLIGKNAIIPMVLPLATHGAFMTVFRAKHPKFTFQLFQTDNYYNQVNADLGATINSINGKNFLKYKFIVPKPNEQQKIASCLSSLDEVIAAHSQKLDLLKEHKKGLMQNLFPQEGKKVPKLRFKEFVNDGEWVETTFGSTATFINGRAYKQEELLDKGKYRVLRVGNFFTNNNWYYSDLELDADKYCDNGDLLYAWSASFGPRIWQGEKTIYHYHIWKVVENPEIDKNFLLKLLDNETEKMKSQNANGFALLHITKGTIENWKCKIPTIKNEQQKIASCISSLDALIEAQTEKIEQLRLHKKGLMQCLIPKINDYK